MIVSRWLFALTAATWSMATGGPARPQANSNWVIEAKDGVCTAFHGGTPRGPGVAAVHAFKWRPNQGLLWMIIDGAEEGAKPTEAIAARVTTGAGVRLEGEAEHWVEGDSQGYAFATDDRKDVSVLLSGDLTYSYPGREGRDVSFTLPLAQQLPRLRNCMTAARTQSRQLAQSGAQQPTTGRAPARRDSAEPELKSYGSGVFVTASGHLLTNAHVVEGCRRVGNRAIGAGHVLAVDAASDLALVQFQGRPRGYVTFRPTNLRLGEAIVTAGFPLSGLLENGLNVTNGNVSALAGLGGDRRFVQFTAPIQAGNSGGPLLDASGRLSGVVSASLSLEARSATGGAENINWAVAPFVVQAFLMEHGVKYVEGRETRETSESIAAKARTHTVPIECWG